MYEQIIPFNRSKAGSTKNMCLRNTRMGFGIPSLYADAWTAWVNTEQHTGTPPSGLDVPVYFSYKATIGSITKNWGHIGVRLKDGRFWSDGTIYPSISAYTSTHAPKYVGWGESINKVKVIKGEEMYKGKSAKYWYDQYVHKTKVSKIWRARYDKVTSYIKAVWPFSQD